MSARSSGPSFRPEHALKIASRASPRSASGGARGGTSRRQWCRSCEEHSMAVARRRRTREISRDCFWHTPTCTTCGRSHATPSCSKELSEENKTRRYLERLSRRHARLVALHEQVWRRAARQAERASVLRRVRVVLFVRGATRDGRGKGPKAVAAAVTLSCSCDAASSASSSAEKPSWTSWAPT